MQVIQSPKELTRLLFCLKQNAKEIGFIPTMGCLHEGHLSLVKRAKKENDVVVVSIFVNPTQFGPKEDFKNYPRTIQPDLAMLRKAKVDFVFLPSVLDIYPKDFESYLNAGKLSRPLCGKTRPTHFDGVVTVVKRLFDIALPDRAYFGQKDFQQFRVIEEMTSNFYLPTRVILCATVREKDGLAMSSRNRYLKPDDRVRAVLLWKSLKLAEKMIRRGIQSPKIIQTEMRRLLGSQVDSIDYVEVVNAKSLMKIHKIKGRILIAVACFLGKARLIDNLLIHV